MSGGGEFEGKRMQHVRLVGQQSQADPNVWLSQSISLIQMRASRPGREFDAFFAVFESCMTPRQFFQFFLAAKRPCHYFSEVHTYQMLTHIKFQVERISSLGEKIDAAR